MACSVYFLSLLTNPGQCQRTVKAELTSEQLKLGNAKFVTAYKPVVKTNKYTINVCLWQVAPCTKPDIYVARTKKKARKAVVFISY